MSASPLLVTPGTILDGKYVVEGTLGEGGMGVVVAARHTVLNTRVAIKVLLPGATVDEETVERFHREARSAVRIHSPHAARVHDVGTLADGTPYMVMDLLTGKDLSAMLDERGPLSPPEVVSYVRQALEALHEAHALGIIHRDLKPANLFLADQPNGPPIVKVLDFGIARDFHEGNEQRLTRTRAVMGSPAYMSPEQMREARSADVRSDIWSTGVCLYELLTGRPPFNADTLPDLFVTVLQGTPVPPSTLRHDLPPGLSETVLRCLEKDPARRFQSARELAHALATGESGASWPAARTTAATTSSRVIVIAAGTPSNPSLPSTERLATSRTLADNQGGAPRMKSVWLALAAFGVVGVGVVGATLFLQRRPPPPVVVAATHEVPAPPPPPIDLSTAGAAVAVPPPPATGTASATPPPASAGATITTNLPRRVVRPAPTPSATQAVAPPPPTPVAPPPPPPFDPKQVF